jgi:hypothetical protein
VCESTPESLGAGAASPEGSSLEISRRMQTWWPLAAGSMLPGRPSIVSSLPTALLADGASLNVASTTAQHADGFMTTRPPMHNCRVQCRRPRACDGHSCVQCDLQHTTLWR